MIKIKNVSAGPAPITVINQLIIFNHLTTLILTHFSVVSLLVVE